MSKNFKKLISAVLTLCMIFTLVQGFCLTAQAAGTSVKIVSFVRGERDDLRSSELLEAKVEGYDGNISDLTFKWDNQIGTYLYVYNSSNMYNIKDTAGEVEINGGLYILGIQIIKGDNYSGKGYAWASVYGANLINSSLKGTITVTVTDKDGNVIGTDSYTDFNSHSLQSDLAAAKYGAFEGETISLKDMLGRSSIVHIDCEACIVGEASTTNTDIIEVTKTDSEYLVKGLKSGVANISLSLQKKNCKFHRESGVCEINNEVYVFKKPATSTTTTTLTLANIDSKCEYFIGSKQGTVSGDKVVFTGLTPDTTYEVTVRGNYGDGYAYAYVTDTTKPVFRAIVNFYTDDVLADTLDYFKVSKNLFLKEKDGNEYIELTKGAVGKYTAEVANGIYYVYYKNESYTRFGDYQITIDNENNELNIHTYSVRYDANGGTFSGTGGVYQAGGAAYVTNVYPKRDGYIFLHWTDDKGNEYKPGQVLTSEISKPYVLKAQWEKAVKVKVNVKINHGQDHSANDDVYFRIIKLVDGMGTPTANTCTLSAESHDGYEYKASGTVSTYEAITKKFDGEADAEYSVSCAKSDYELTSVTSYTEAEGDIVIDVVLDFEPNNFDLVFNVEMDEDIPSYLYPAGVSVQVTYWGYDSNNNLGWHIIEQHKNGTVVPVGFDEQGKGTASYPVWQLWADGVHPYYYRIDVVSYILADGTIVAKEKNAFTSEVTIIGNGGYPTYPDGSGQEYAGAYYANGVQNGTPVATISIDSYNLTFDANGGKINGNNTLTLAKQVVIPDTLKYVPTRDGGYVFNGWYTDKACTVKAVDGTRLTGDTTLYADWKEPLSISGTITVDGFYFNDKNVQVNVLDVDRATNLVTTLQIKRNGTYNDYASVDAKLNYVNNVTTVNYDFDEIPDAGEEFRIRTSLINYETTYDNNGNGEFTESEYVAIFNQANEAEVDAKLTFKADEFDQAYRIDATLVGEAYRPEVGLTQVLFQTTGSNPPDTVISQHEVAPHGEVLEFANGIAKGSVRLWKGISSGAMSSYQLKLTELDNKAYTHESPYSVRYGATTSWSVTRDASGILTATIVPKEYVVKFDLNADGDTIGNMESFESDTGYFTIHKWSYDTLIAANPTRDGYVFLGWEAVEENTFDETTQSVKGSVAKDITIRAKWQQFKWTTDVDSGYFATEEGKKAVVRFLFDIEATEEFKQKITKTGIKFIKSENIAEKVEDSEFELSEGSYTTFYGDIVNITEEKANVKYYAIAYLTCDGETFWSLPIECGPDFNDLIIYE